MANRKRPERAGSTERKVLFYRLNGGRGAGGAPLNVDLLPALRHIHGLPFDETGKYHSFRDGNALACWSDNFANPLRFRLGQIRRSGLPGIEDGGGRIRQLEIPARSGLAEVTHFVVFDTGIAGVEFNFYGPRPSRLPLYLRAKSGNLVREFTCDPLLKRDIERKLDQMGQLKMFQLRIDPAFVQVVERANQALGSAFRAALDAGEADVVEILMKRTGRRADAPGLAAGLMRAIRRIARQGGLQEHADVFKVKGVNFETEKLELIDVLSDELVAFKNIRRVSERSRQLNSEAAYDAIEEAYAEMKDDLLEAATIGV